MLPFLQPKKMSSTILAKRRPDGTTQDMNEEGMPSPALMAVAEDLISAVHAKDAMKVASVLESAFEILKPEREIVSKTLDSTGD